MATNDNKFTVPKEKTVLSESFQLSVFRTMIEQDYDVLFVNCDNEESHNIVLCIICDDAWEKWFDNSSNTNHPPDFYSDFFKLMMEAMVVNDNEEILLEGNKQIILDREMMRQGQIKNDFVKYVRDNKLEDTFKHLGLFISTSQEPFEHSYTNYLSYMKRVVSEHVKKIDDYRRNHPGKKLIFFVYDTSTYYQYIMINHENEVNIISHEWFTDEKLLNNFKETNIDYLLWFTPYKRSDLDPCLPLAVLIDIRKEIDCQEYNPKYVVLPEEIDNMVTTLREDSNRE